MDESDDREQAILVVLRDAFKECGRWRVTHVEPTGMSHVEDVTSGQLATLAYNALNMGRESLAGALYNHEPKFQRRAEGTEQRRYWTDLYAAEKAIYLTRADAVLDHFGGKK